MRQKCAQVAGTKGLHLCATDWFPAMSRKEIKEALRGRDIGADGVRRTAAIILKMFGPASDELASRRRVQFGAWVSHRRIIAARLVPRNINNSDP